MVKANISYDEDYRLTLDTAESLSDGGAQSDEFWKEWTAKFLADDNPDVYEIDESLVAEWRAARKNLMAVERKIDEAKQSITPNSFT